KPRIEESALGTVVESRSRKVLRIGVAERFHFEYRVIDEQVARAEKHVKVPSRPNSMSFHGLPDSLCSGGPRDRLADVLLVPVEVSLLDEVVEGQKSVRSGHMTFRPANEEEPPVPVHVEKMCEQFLHGSICVQNHCRIPRILVADTGKSEGETLQEQRNTVFAYAPGERAGPDNSPTETEPLHFLVNPVLLGIQD